MTYTVENFNSGKGKMEQGAFLDFANRMGMDNAIWLAKYFGVSLITVRAWVKEYMENLK